MHKNSCENMTRGVVVELKKICETMKDYEKNYIGLFCFLLDQIAFLVKMDLFEKELIKNLF